jgi:hypothetical protein
MKLSDPYPFCPGLRKSLATALLISVFVVAFLGFFQPFDLHQVRGSGKTWFILGYGIVNFVVIMINMLLLPYLFPSFFDEKKWKVYKELLFLSWMLFTIGLGNFLYTKILFNYPDDILMGFLSFQLYTLAVGIFPVIISIVLNYNHQLRKNLELAGSISTSLSPDRSGNIDDSQRITLSADSKKESLELPLKDILFIQSEGNYVIVYFREESDIKRSILRNTLKNTQEELGPHFPPLFRTHRSYIVNLSLVERIKGNSQGLQLYLPELEDFIPVSRAYIKKFRETLSSFRK